MAHVHATQYAHTGELFGATLLGLTELHKITEGPVTVPALRVLLSGTRLALVQRAAEARAAGCLACSAFCEDAARLGTTDSPLRVAAGDVML